jgi:tetratricopeptide (TPR) repeat protein
MLSKHVALIVCLSVLQTSVEVPQAFAHERRSMAAPPHALGQISLITPDQTQSIYRHLVETHWVPETGLFLSYPDSMDRKLSQQASIYEQGAIGLLAIRLGDIDRARGLFQFLKNTWETEALKPERNGLHGLDNFYNAEFGTGGIEKTVHLGPNAWAGLFAARLANVTKDPEALQWSMDVAYWITNVLPHENGAVAMSPRDEPGGAPWAHIFSTENNLSYYAMLTELLRSPRLDPLQRAGITRERDHVENWLVHTAFDRTTYQLRRGINPNGNDDLPALDTVTWFISTIGPRRLAEKGIDPQRLMAIAAKNFEVTVAGRRGVDPTNKAEAAFTYLNSRTPNGQAGRPTGDEHRLIWYEGLGQYILALSTMADYLNHIGETAAAKEDLRRAKEMTQSFDLAALHNYREGSAFPYATPGKFFRDGWQTQAESKDGPASSLIAAAWRCFAGLGYDPVSGRDIGTIQAVKVELPGKMSVAHRRPAVLFGTSEEMVVNAWRALERKNLEEAIDQAQATIQEWSPWALKLQEKKRRELGNLINYTGLPEEQRRIFSYWALNDVGSAYFILGKAYDEKGDYTNAALAFRQVVNHYSLAQVWDPRGWFWAPMDAISNDYVSRDPDHYRAIMPQELADGSFVGKNPN